MIFLELARNVCQPQLSEVWRSFSDREEAIVSECASRGWSCLNGADYEKINKLGKNILKEMSEIIWNSLVDSYDASEKKPSREELQKFFENEINQNAHSIAETIVDRIEQQNVNIRLPDIGSQKEYARKEIEAEREHLICLLSGQLNVFLGKLKPHQIKLSKYDVFISYSKKDNDVASEIRDSLSGRQIKCFMAEKDIASGMVWEEEILNALKESPIGIILLTPNSFNSNWVMCEAGAFWALGKSLVAPYMFVDIDKLPEPIKKYQCKPIQTIEARKILCDEIFNLCQTDVRSEN